MTAQRSRLRGDRRRGRLLMVDRRERRRHPPRDDRSSRDERPRDARRAAGRADLGGLATRADRRRPRRGASSIRRLPTPIRPHLLDGVHAGRGRGPDRGPVVRRERVPDATARSVAASGRARRRSRLSAGSSASTATWWCRTRPAAGCRAPSSRRTCDPGASGSWSRDGGPAVVSRRRRPRLVDETSRARSARLRATSLAGRRVVRPRADTGRSAAAGHRRRVRVGHRRPARVGRARPGRPPSCRSRRSRALLRRVPDGLTVPIDEAIR